MQGVDLIIENIKKDINDSNNRIVVPEGNEIRVIKSLGDTPEIKKVLLGDENEIKNLINEEYPNNSEEILKMVEFYNDEDILTDENIKIFVDKRKGKVTEEQAREMLKEKPYIATMLVETGFVNAMVGGSFYSTKDILRPALQIVKAKDRIVSSYFIMTKEDQVLLFADCAVNVNPTSEDLAEIAHQTIKTAMALNIEPRCALISYSSLGSGQGPDVEKVVKAKKIFEEKYPEFIKYIDGEFQFDTAYSMDVAKIKVKDLSIAGQANIFVFPSLEAGNIGYKIAQFMGGWDAVGPIVQGLNKNINDLSRGTTPETIAKVMYLSLVETK